MSKVCIYHCNKEIQWDKKESVFKELDGTVHNKQRCESLKQVPNGHAVVTTNEKEAILQNVVKTMHELITELERLKV